MPMATNAALAGKPKPGGTVPASGRRGGIDAATVIGLSSGFVVIGLSIALGGAAAAFVSLPGLLIVLGGTMAVTLASFSFQEFVSAQSTMMKTLRTPGADPRDAALLVLRLADGARKKGVLALQGVLPQLQREALLAKGLLMAMDGIPDTQVEEFMQREMHATSDRHLRSADVLRRAAEVAPAMGLIGTLVGLVQMLGRLDDPTTIGPSMAVALLTTFYGAVLANMLFSPMAAKLDRNAGQERLVNQVYILGATSIARQENPRRLEMLVNAVLPPALRVTHFK